MHFLIEKLHQAEADRDTALTELAEYKEYVVGLSADKAALKTELRTALCACGEESIEYHRHLFTCPYAAAGRRLNAESGPALAESDVPMAGA